MAPTTLQVRDVMSREVHTVKRNDELAIADALMKQERVRHLPVLDEDGEVCAVVSQRDLFRGALLRALGYGSRAEDLMLKQMAGTFPNQDLTVLAYAPSDPPRKIGTAHLDAQTREMSYRPEQ